MNKKLFLLLAFAILFSGSAFAQEAEEEKDWSATLDLPLYSKYVWRGINLVDNWVFQPSLEGNYKWITATVWTSMELTNENEYPTNGHPAGDITEIDYIVDLSHEIGKLGISAGANIYTFPNTDFDPTTEVYAGLSLDVITQPSVTVYHDVDLVHGYYVNFQTGHSFEEIWKPGENAALSLDIGAGLGLCDEKHGKYYYIEHGDGWVFSDALFQLGLPLSIGDYITVTPSAYYSVLIDDKIRDATEKDENFWWGVSLAFSL